MSSIQVQLITSVYRGDHSSDVRVAYEVKNESEPIAQFVERILGGCEKGDYIEIRIAQ